jgi:hypothetical protein
MVSVRGPWPSFSRAGRLPETFVYTKAVPSAVPRASEVGAFQT